MSSVSSKYIKDESGNKVSPITSADSVYINTTKLTTLLSKIQVPEVIYGQGYAYSPAVVGQTITLDKPIEDYNLIRFDWLARYYGENTEPLPAVSWYFPRYYGSTSTKRVILSDFQHRSANVFYAGICFYYADAQGTKLYVEYNKLHTPNEGTFDNFNGINKIYGYKNLI